MHLVFAMGSLYSSSAHCFPTRSDLEQMIDSDEGEDDADEETHNAEGDQR